MATNKGSNSQGQLKLNAAATVKLKTTQEHVFGNIPNLASGTCILKVSNLWEGAGKVLFHIPSVSIYQNCLGVLFTECTHQSQGIAVDLCFVKPTLH